MPRLAMSLIALAAVVACRSDIDPCQAILLAEQPGLTVTASSRSAGGCQWVGPSVPLGYEIVRPAYTVRMLPFMNNSAGLGLLVEGSSDPSLELVNDAFMDAEELQIEIGDGYRYWVLPAWLDVNYIAFSVVDSAGHEVGREKLPFTVARGEHRAMRVRWPSWWPGV